MERRKAIKNIGLSFGAFVATPAAVSLLQSCEAQDPWFPGYFTEEEGVVLRQLVDTLLPAVDELPSATQLNVHIFIDKFVGTVFDSEQQVETKEGLGIVIKDLLSIAGKDKVSRIKPEDYEAYLGDRLRKTKEEDESLRERIANDDDTDEVKVYAYLTGLRDMSIWAYRTSEQIGEQVLAYKPVPGEQKGCVDLQEATGGKMWSLGW